MEQRSITKVIKFLISIIFLFLCGCFNELEKESWHEDAIWYQIFPDRFYNGDLSNDPNKNSLMGTWPYDFQESWSVMPWTSEWYKLQPWEMLNKKDFYYNAQLRRYGGDLQGIIEKLDYIKDLGVNAIYLNPIFESPSAHKYGVKYYHHVDNNFGPNPSLDEKIWSSEDPSDPSTWKWTSADSLFLKLINEIHSRDMHIIIDGVFNHVGIPFWAMDDVMKNGRNSKYADWFIIESWDDPETEINEFSYKGWFGFKDLPEFSENDFGLIPPIQDHIHAIIKRWMDPNGDGDPSDGIDGWRLDVAEKVNIKFWKTFRRWVNEINPNAYLTGEVWWENYFDNVMINASPWINDDVFDSVMNYRFADLVYKFFIDDKNKITAEFFGKSFAMLIEEYGYSNILKIQNLLGSHDTERLASTCVNPDRWIDHANNLNYNPEFKIRKPNLSEYNLQKQITTFQFMFPGTPYVFYGDEVGMWGADDPDSRKPMIWEELDYENETTDPFNNLRNPDIVSVNNDLLSHYKILTDLRAKYISLRRGDYELLYAEDTIFAFSRSYKDEKIISIFNTSKNHRKFDFNLLGIAEIVTPILQSDKSKGLPPHSFRVYEVN